MRTEMEEHDIATETHRVVTNGLPTVGPDGRTIRVPAISEETRALIAVNEARHAARKTRGIREEQ